MGKMEGGVDHRTVSHFQVVYREEKLGSFGLHVPGAHNVLNATAAIAVGVGLDVPVEKIREALDNFRGVDRRFQVRGQAGGITVVDDYGHHPTEIKATLLAARQCGYGKIHVIFQPHRYTRTQALMDEFGGAFSEADSIFVLDIYAASEQPIEGISGQALADRVRQSGKVNVEYVSSFASAVQAILSQAKPGDLILTLGAGNVHQLGPMILDRVAAGEPASAPVA
jgi:UDP-N-acetylmuramate--alanine ligase